ncbi:MAG: hypothetical protein AB7K24_30755, partial [Gemmataceae bacterium]
MSAKRMRVLAGSLVLVAGLLVLTHEPAQAYVEAPMSLGAVIQQSSNIMLLEVTGVDKQNNRIT